MKFKKQKLFLFIMLLSFILFYCDGFAYAGVATDLRGFPKILYMTEDIVRGVDPNVLLLLDVSTAMTFNIGGVMPYRDDGRTLEQRANMLSQSTYGHGMRPPVFDGTETTQIKGGLGIDSNSFSRYGRDMDESNNYIGSPDCYYTSHPEKPFLLTFKNRLLAHRTTWIDDTGRLVAPSRTNLPSGPLVGGTPTTVEVNEALEDYRAITDYLPRRYVRDVNGYWIPDPTAAALNPVPLETANAVLVPNDSRIYKMKLALWRLTSHANSEVLSRMNVGVAITYQHLVGDENVNYYSVATKNASPDIKTEAQGLRRRGYYGATIKLPFGNAATYITGLSGSDSDPDEMDLDGQFAGQAFMSQLTNRGVLVELYLDRSPGDRIWNSLSRATMYVPFNKFYERAADGSVNKTTQLDDFRSYIMGYEEFNGIYSEAYEGRIVRMKSRPVKDEFWASGLTLLSTAIYGGRNSSEGRNFPFHKGIYNSSSSGGYYGTDEYLIQYAVTSKDNAGSTIEDVVYLDPSINSEGLPTGQAIGSVIDFFSPPTTTVTNGADGLDFNNNTIGFFPVIGSCQTNWLIVFCSGIDAVPDYPPEEAVRRLFQNTRTMRGRRLDGTTWVENREYEMDSGVRTLVVGFLPQETPGEEPEIRQVRTTLKAMAEEGDPILLPDGTYVRNAAAEPEIASDVPGLIKAFNNVLRRIYVEKMGSGTVSLPAVIDNISDPDVRVVFGAAYRMNPLDQWNGWLGKYYVNGSTSLEAWEANTLMMLRMNDRVLYTSAGTLNSNNTNVQPVTAQLIQQLIRPSVPNIYQTPLFNWLLRYDNTATSNTTGILGDMVNSGITVVGRPKHEVLANNSAIRSRDAAVYIQTNRGVLHALNYMNGNEIWAFTPPNIFQSKIRNLKFDEDEANVWLAGNGLTRVNSNPMVLLDGMLIARDVVNANVPRTYLTGYLGHGGNGFYTMDITEMDGSSKTPVFKWAIENARYDVLNDVAPGDSTRIKRWGIATTGGSIMPNYNYTDLGLTINPGVYLDPAVGDDTVGVLPGGLGHKLQDVNDSQGKAFYIFNPINGAIIRKIDSASNASTGFEAPPGRSLGMAISPVIHLENAKKRTIEFYTADSEGNILQCNTDSTAPQNWSLKSIFQLRTLGGLYPYEGSVAIPPAGDLRIAIPRKMLLARSRNNYSWLFGGTSNLYAPGSDVDSRKRLINGEQYIFGLNVNNITRSSELNSGIVPANGNIRRLRYYIDDISSKYGRYGTEIYNYDPDALGVTHGMNDYGWLLRLRPKFGVSGAEYLTADPFLMNNILYLATFIPFEGTKVDEICSDVGVSKIYVLDPSTGLSVLSDDSSIILDNIKIVGITGSRDSNRLILSAKELRLDSKSSIFSNFTNVLDIGNGLFEIDAPAGKPYEPTGGDPELDFEELVPHIQYWSESFK